MFVDALNYFLHANLLWKFISRNSRNPFLTQTQSRAHWTTHFKYTIFVVSHITSASEFN